MAFDLAPLADTLARPALLCGQQLHKPVSNKPSRVASTHFFQLCAETFQEPTSSLPNKQAAVF
jgi:hypothetical protein